MTWRASWCTAAPLAVLPPLTLHIASLYQTSEFSQQWSCKHVSCPLCCRHGILSGQGNWRWQEIDTGFNEGLLQRFDHTLTTYRSLDNSHCAILFGGKAGCITVLIAVHCTLFLPAGSLGLLLEPQAGTVPLCTQTRGSCVWKAQRPMQPGWKWMLRPFSQQHRPRRRCLATPPCCCTTASRSLAAKPQICPTRTACTSWTPWPWCGCRRHRL